MVIAFTVFSGCATTPVKSVSVEILSEPAGAKIEINNDYIGTTPCTAQIPANIMGEFTRDTTIQAFSPDNSKRSQVKRFSGGYDHGENDLIPKRILFNMAL
jgi:hypothetical protein